MITDKDIEKMQKVFATSKDHINLEKKIDKLVDAVNKKPDREEFPQLLDRVLEYTTI